MSRARLFSHCASRTREGGPCCSRMRPGRKGGGLLGDAPPWRDPLSTRGPRAQRRDRRRTVLAHAPPGRQICPQELPPRLAPAPILEELGRRNRDRGGEINETPLQFQLVESLRHFDSLNLAALWEGLQLRTVVARRGALLLGDAPPPRKCFAEYPWRKRPPWGGACRGRRRPPTARVLVRDVLFFVPLHQVFLVQMEREDEKKRQCFVFMAIFSPLPRWNTWGDTPATIQQRMDEFLCQLAFSPHSPSPAQHALTRGSRPLPLLPGDLPALSTCSNCMWAIRMYVCFVFMTIFSPPLPRWNTWGDTPATIQQRMDEFLCQLAFSPHDNIVVVGHSHFFREVFRKYIHPDFEQQHATFVQELRKKTLSNAGVVYGPTLS